MSPRIGGGVSIGYGTGVGGGPAPAAGSIPLGAELVTPWDTALGQTDAALLDTDAAVPWPTSAYGGGTLEIVDATAEGLNDWPMNNAMKVELDQHLRNDKVRVLTSDGVLTELNAGEYRGYRWYFQYRMPDGADYRDSQHVVEQNDGGYSPTEANWVWITAYDNSPISTPDGTWRGWWACQNIAQINPDGWPYWTIMPPSNLTKGNVTYRFELIHMQVTSTDYKIFYRISDASTEAILHDHDDMVYRDGSTAFDPTRTYGVQTRAELAQLQVGSNEGPSASATYPLLWGYYGGFMVWRGVASDIADVDWAGAFDASEYTWGGP